MLSGTVENLLACFQDCQSVRVCDYDYDRCFQNSCVNDVHLVNSVALHNAQLNQTGVSSYILHNTLCIRNCGCLKSWQLIRFPFGSSCFSIGLLPLSPKHKKLNVTFILIHIGLHPTERSHKPWSFPTPAPSDPTGFATREK